MGNNNYHCQSQPDNFESTFKTAMTVVEALLFIVVVGVFIALKAYVSQLWADLWMLIAFTIVLHDNMHLVEPKVRERLKDKTHIEDEEDNTPTASTPKQDIDSDSSKS